MKGKSFSNKLLPLSIVMLFIALFLPGNQDNISLASQDKSIHVILFLGVGINLFYTYRAVRSRLVFLLLLVGFAFLSEYLQHYIPGRFMDMRDAIAGATGSVIAFVLYFYLEKYIDRFVRFIGA